MSAAPAAYCTVSQWGDWDCLTDNRLALKHTFPQTRKGVWAANITFGFSFPKRNTIQISATQKNINFTGKTFFISIFFSFFFMLLIYIKMWDVYCMRLSELQPFVLISGIFKKNICTDQSLYLESVAVIWESLDYSQTNWPSVIIARVTL